MRLIGFKKLSQRGDTIVEVLISIGVISLILGGAFVVTNRSLQGTREAQERQNALKLVQAQLEQIKELAADSPDTLFGTGVPTSYCITPSNTVVASGNSACAVGADGTPSSAEPVFHLSVSRDTNTFTVTNTWQNISGDGQDNVEMKYRVYQ
jgi:type II secretory pathway pseudopilin PulG